MRALPILLLLLAAPAARADDKEVARQAYVEGTRYYDLNDFTHALDAFKRAYLHFDEPVLLYNIAQCHRQLGDKNEALKFYRSYLRKAPNAPNKEEVKRLIAGLEAAVAQDQKTRTGAPQGIEEPRPPALEAPVTPPPPPPPPVAAPPKPDPKLAMAELQRKQQEEKVRKEKEEIETRRKIEEKKEQEKREAKRRETEEREARRREEAQKREARRLEEAQRREAQPGADQPVWKKWWLWTAVGGVVVVGVGLGVGLGIGLRSDSFSPTLRGVGPGAQALEF